MRWSCRGASRLFRAGVAAMQAIQGRSGMVQTFTATCSCRPRSISTSHLLHDRGSPDSEAHVLAPGVTEHLVPMRVRRSVIAAAASSAVSTSIVDDPAWDHAIVRNGSVKFTDSAQLRLRRRALVSLRDVREVLIVKKPRNQAASNKLRDISAWLCQQGIKVVVERGVHATEVPQYEAYNPRVHHVDFCISLGGDGTVLHLASLFEEDVPLPPIMSFAMGTLGFLTPFDAADFVQCLTRVLNSDKEPLFCTLRTRKRCEMRNCGESVCVHNVLNEVVIDRGAFPGAVSLELFVDGSFVTNIEADGLIIATPSGSTAYSMSAGGPMIAPSVPCTILTPIAPLSLSFRPLVIPESSDILIHLPRAARSYARCSFDGKNPLRMRRDSSLSVTTSLCPLPMINLGTLDSDWYEGITQKLKWNQSIRSPPKLPTYQASGRHHEPSNGHGGPEEAEDEDAVPYP